MILKKITSIFICLCLVCSVMLAAVSCGDDEKTTENKTDTPTDAPTDENTEGKKDESTEKKPNISTDDKNVKHTVFVNDIYDKAPIPGVTVELYNKNDELVTSGSTDSDGKVEFMIPDIVYTLRLSDVPDNYENESQYIFGEVSNELHIELLDEADYVMDGRDEEHGLPVYNNDEITVGARQTLYLSSARTPGYILTLKNADGIKVVYNEKEYIACDGVIVVEFAEQEIGFIYSMPNDFAIINNGDADYSAIVSILSKNAGQSKGNPFDLVTGDNTTPDFVQGTSSTDPGVTVYYYKFVANADGVLSITTDNAVISIYLNDDESPLVDDNYERINTVELSMNDSVIIAVENPDGETTPVGFTVSFT